MKDLLEITDSDLNDLYSVGASWEIFRVKKQYGIIDIKFRKPYSETDIKFNEDGYEYKSVYIHPNNLSLQEVIAFNKKGYRTPYNNL